MNFTPPLCQPFALATDTIWGLACLASDEQAVARIYSLKNREDTKPLVLFVSNLRAAAKIQQIPESLFPWLQAIWPGALTLVSRAVDLSFSHCHPHTDMIGVRIPNHPAPLNLMKAGLEPLAVTSLNLSGGQPLTSIDELNELFPGFCPPVVGQMTGATSPSTVLSLVDHTLTVLRGKTEQIRFFANTLPAGYKLSWSPV